MTRVHTNLRLAGILIILGMLVQIPTFFGARALAFIVYTFIGGGLVAAGVLVYLWSIVSSARE